MSHKFLDEALAEAGAADKTSAMFRAMYAAATATTKVTDIDGKVVHSRTFSINRGVIQGDIVSPLYFVLALELILRRHDTHPDKGISFGEKKVSTLGYADDATLIDNDLAVASARVNSIAVGSKDDADMSINTDKTEIMHVREQGRVTAVTAEQAKSYAKWHAPT